MKKLYDQVIWFIETNYWVFFAGIAAVTAFLCFRCLDVAYVSSWDEARHGVSAYEMMQNKNYVVNTFGYEPDYWNLKPPLSFYGIILGFRLFGYSVLGLRFYSACAYFLICIFVGLFLKKYHKLTSLIGMCFLCCNHYVLGFHCARSGDADALFLLFFVLSMLAMLEIPKKHSRMYVCGVCFSLAFLTKSFHAGVIAVIGGMYLLLTGEIKRIRPKEWLFFGLSVLIPLGVWFGARFSCDGMTFFREMVQTDLLNRSSSASEGHGGNFWFYYEAYFKDFHTIYPYLLITAVAGSLYYGFRALWRQRMSREGKNLIIGCGLWLMIPFLFFSAVSTKLVWYGYPIFIPLMVIAAIFLGRFFTEELWRDKTMGILLKGVTALAFAGLIAVNGYNTYLSAVREIHGDGFQIFISESIDRDSEDAGKTAYIEVPQEMEDGTIWNQHVRFLAEIYGDLRCEDGGLEVFLKDEDALLYISRDRYEAGKEKLAESRVLYEEESYLLVKK